MGADLQPDGLTAGSAGHCQPDKKTTVLKSIKSIVSEITKEIRVFASR